MDAIFGALLFAGLTMPVVDPIIEVGLCSHQSLPDRNEQPAEQIVFTRPIIALTASQAAGEPSGGERRRHPAPRPSEAPRLQHRADGGDRLAPRILPAPTSPHASPRAASYSVRSEATAEGQESIAGTASGQSRLASPFPGETAGLAPEIRPPGTLVSPPQRARLREVYPLSRCVPRLAGGQPVPRGDIQQTAGSSCAPLQRPTKPLPAYPPSTTVTPYLNLFRGATGVAHAENYYTLVRPMLQQQSQNAQFAGELQQLQRTVARQGQILHRMESGGGSYYQNTWGYYPGLAR